MRKELIITIERPDLVHAGKFKQLYRDVIVLDDNITIDFNLLLDAFKILYPYKDTIVSFKIM